MNNECDTYRESGKRNIVSNTFRLSTDRKSTGSQSKEACDDNASVRSNSTSSSRSLRTTCTVCRMVTTNVEECDGRVVLEVVLKVGHDSLEGALPKDSPGVIVAYFTGQHRCRTLQDNSKRIGKDVMRANAAAAPSSTPSSFAVGAITKMLSELAGAASDEGRQDVVRRMDECMPALTDEASVRQEHRSSKKSVKGDRGQGVGGVELLRRSMDAAEWPIFKSSPNTGSDPIPAEAPVNKEQRWLLMGASGLDLLRRMQPGGDLEMCELSMDDMFSCISEDKWHVTVGTVWDPRKKKMWILYVCYKRGLSQNDFQQVWRDLCDAHGSVLRLKGFQGDAAASHWIALQNECPNAGQYGDPLFYTLLTVHADENGEGGRSYLADPHTNKSRESACSYHVTKCWKDEAEKGGWNEEEKLVIKQCGNAFAGLPGTDVEVCVAAVEDIIDRHSAGKGTVVKKLRLMRKLAEHELMEPQLHGPLSNEHSRRHSLTEGANSAHHRFVPNT